MQRQRYNKILQSDYDGMSDRASGMPILQSHGNLVSRGDLITQDNISIPDVFTITINKDNFSQLCTVGNPGQLADYDPTYIPDSNPTHGTTITGTYSVDSGGIYASNYGSGSQWHGPVFYSIMPSSIGASNQYWHITYKYTVTNQSISIITAIVLRVGFSTMFMYYDGSGGYIAGFRRVYLHNNNQVNKFLENNVSTVTDTIRFYHYANNTVAVYLNQSLIKSDQDPIQLNKDSNILSMYIPQWQSYSTPYHRIQEITVSTDPSYDPQP